MGNYLVHEEDYKGYTIKIYYDNDSSPRDWDTLGTIYSGHHRYDPQNHKMEEIIWFDDNGMWHVNDDYIYLKLGLYDHSGVTIWSCRANEPVKSGWDSGLFGLYACSKQQVIDEFGSLSEENIEAALKCMEAEVNVWDMYFRGDVYYYEVEDENENNIDSCGGFYGDWNDEEENEILNVAKEAIDYEVKEREKREAVVKPFWID